MPLTQDELLSHAMSLDPAAREWLADRLFSSLTGETRESLDAATLAEAKRRHDEYLAGRDTTSSVDEVIARVVGRVRR